MTSGCMAFCHRGYRELCVRSARGDGAQRSECPTFDHVFTGSVTNFGLMTGINKAIHFALLEVGLERVIIS